MKYSDKIPQILETKRLILEPLNIGHSQELFIHFSDEEVTKFMDIEVLKTIEEAENIINYYLKVIDEKKCYRWAIIKKSDNSFIGTCGFNSWIIHRGNRSEIGYDLSKEYWGYGYMTEALQILLQYGFEKMNLYRIEALVNLGNFRSIKVLKGLGFSEEGILRGYGYWKNKYIDEHIFSILKKDWMNSL